MKQWIAGFVAGLCLFSLTACKDSKPSLEEVEQAIEEGSLTIEDALQKGFVTQEWVDDYMQDKQVPMGDKFQAHMIGDFETTTLSGEKFTKEQVNNVTFFAFLTPDTEEGKTFYEELVKGYEGVKANGGDIVVCIKNQNSNEIFADAPFPVILYNDSVREAAKNNREMVEESENIASWYVNGAFFSAWYSKADSSDLPDSAAAFVQMQQEMSEGENTETGMAAMG